MFFNFDLQYKLHWTTYGLEKHPPPKIQRLHFPACLGVCGGEKVWTGSPHSEWVAM